MASPDRSTVKHEGDGGTFVELTKVRMCQKIAGKKLCTPFVNESAHIHFGPDAAEKIKNGNRGAGAAVTTFLASTGIGMPAAAIVALVAALIEVGINTSMNSDGSLDVYFDNVRAASGPARIPIPLDPGVCTTLLQAIQ